MKKIKINNDNIINMKNQFNEITIIEYLQIINLLKSDLDELDKVCGIVSILSGLEVNEINQIDLKVFEELAEDIHFLNSLPTVKLKDVYKIKDIDFKVFYNMQKINVSQYIDMQHLMEKDILENIHKILSLFLCPAKIKKTLFGKVYIAKPYGTYDASEVSDILLNNLTIDIAYSLMVFFCNLTETLINHTQLYLMKNLKMLNKTLPKNQRLNKDILKDGDGLLRLIKYRKELELRGKTFG